MLTFDDLTPNQIWAFGAIVAERVGRGGRPEPHEACAGWAEVDAVYPGVLDELTALGLTERWARPDGDRVTLTPYGAFLVRYELDERWKFERQPSDETDGTARTVAVPCPVWVASGKPTAPRRRPRYAPEGSMRLEDLIADPAPPPEYLMDEETGAAVKILGAPVRLDRRIRPARKVKGRGRVNYRSSG